MNCFKIHSDATEQGNFRGLKLLEHFMKVIKRVFEPIIRSVVDIDATQFGFMPSKDHVNPSFIARQLQ